MMSPELLEELKAALVRKEEARERWAKLELEAGEARAVALEAKKDFRAVCDELEEIESEIRTGLTGMPLVDAATVKRAAPDREAEEDYSAMWSRPWLHSTKLWVAGETVEVEIGYKPEYHGGSLRFGPPLDTAGYAHYGVGKLADGVPVDLPEYYRSRPYEYAERLAYLLARLTTKSGDAKPSDAADAPAWRAVPLGDLNLPKDTKAALRRCGVFSAGDLADAIDLGVDDARLDVNTEAIIVPDGPWRNVVDCVEDLRNGRPFATIAVEVVRPTAAEEARAERDGLTIAESRAVDAEVAKIVTTAGGRYIPPSTADERPVKPAKGTKRGASSAAVGAAAATTP